MIGAQAGLQHSICHPWLWLWQFRVGRVCILFVAFIAPYNIFSASSSSSRGWSPAHVQIFSRPWKSCFVRMNRSNCCDKINPPLPIGILLHSHQQGHIPVMLGPTTNYKRYQHLYPYKKVHQKSPWIPTHPATVVDGLPLPKDPKKYSAGYPHHSHH